MTISVTFKRNSTTYTFQNVKDVTWSNAYSNDLIANSTGLGQKVKEITVNGFIIVHLPEKNIEAQQALETALQAVGSGTLEYTGCSDIEDVHFESLSFDAFRGNPVLQYSVKFKTRTDNPHAYGTVKIGDTTLTPSPSVTEILTPQAQDVPIKSNNSREFKIEGQFEGTLSEIDALQEALITEIHNKSAVIITLIGGTFSGSYTVKPLNLEFKVPKLKDASYAREYSFTGKMHDDYSIEPYTLGETPISYGGIVVDVVTSYTHDRDFKKYSNTGLQYLSSESISISGKKYFGSVSEYETFRSAIESGLINLSYSLVSINGNTLILTEGNVSQVAKDGFTVGEITRYSATVNLIFSFIKDAYATSFHSQEVVLGIQWHNIENVNFTTTLSDKGVITRNSITLSGKVTAANYAVAKSLLGSSQSYDSNFQNLYITSVNASSIDQYFVNGQIIELYDLSITAGQLDSSAQFSHFISDTFNVRKNDSEYYSVGINFDNITNRSKSVSNRYSTEDQAFIVTSIGLSLSGEIWQLNTTGSPNDTELKALFDLIAADMRISITDRSVSVDEYKYILDSFNIGNWEAFDHPTEIDPLTNKAKVYWKQTVSLSATVIFDISGGGGGGEPDYQDTVSYVDDKEVPTYQTIQVLGYGLVLKKTGIEPAVSTTTIQRRYTSDRTYDPNGASTFALSPSQTFLNTYGNDYVEIRHNVEKRGLTNSETKTWQATKAKAQ